MDELIVATDKIIMSLLPFLIMGGSTSIYYLPLIYLLQILIKWFIEKIKTKIASVNYTYTIYEYDDSDFEYRALNVYYDIISHLLKKNDLLKTINNIKCKKTIYNKNKFIGVNLGGEYIYGHLPVIYPDEKSNIKFTFNNIEVIITSCVEMIDDKHNARFFKIIATDSDHIKKFMEYLDVLDEEMILSLQLSDNYKYCTYDNSGRGFKKKILI